jgi:hypothetical protein
MKERDHLEKLGVYRRIILKCTLKEWSGRILNGVMWITIGTSGGRCEHGDEYSPSTKCGNFLTK